MKTREYINGQWVTVDDPFRKYSGSSDSSRDYWGLLSKNKRYAPYMVAQDADSAYRALQNSGYATDPDYATKLRSLSPDSPEKQAFYNARRDELLKLGADDIRADIGARQSALETGWGNHLAGGNNYYGVKGTASSLPTTNIAMEEPAMGLLQTESGDVWSSSGEGKMDGLLGKFDNPWTQLGLGMLASNNGHYGAFAPALQGGLLQMNEWQGDALDRQEKMDERAGREALAGLLSPEEAAFLKAHPAIATEIYKRRFPDPSDASSEYGNTPIYGVDKDGNPTVMRFGPNGTLHQSALPEGVSSIAEPWKGFDTGSQIQLSGGKTGRQGPTLEKDLGPTETLPYKAGVVAAESDARYSAEKMQGFNKARQYAMSAIDKARFGSAKAQELKDKTNDWTTGWLGSVLKNIPKTDARNVAGLISTLKSHIGFDRLQQMRDESPTGGALGQVSNIELELLTSAFGALDQAQSEADIDAIVDDIIQIVSGREQRMREAFLQDYGVSLEEYQPQFRGGGLLMDDTPADYTQDPMYQEFLRERNGGR